MKRILLISAMAMVTLQGCFVTLVEEPVVVYDYRDDFVGSYQVEEYSETFNSYSEYPIYVVKAGGYPNSLYIENFYGLGLDIMVDIEGSRLYIPLQEVNGYRIEGNGRRVAGELHLDYSVYDRHNPGRRRDFCSAVAWR
ncbi:MAG: hypothetical protein MJA30_13100 [Cytophagales bacterium]|nr:hypothetical protein [Cytophagales bacterium]